MAEVAQVRNQTWSGRRWVRIARVLGAAGLLSLAGCATGPGVAGEAGDPLEPVNRAFFAVNDTLDKALLAPAAGAYTQWVPEVVRDRVFQFFDNLAYPTVALNALLQGKVEQALEDAMRFLFNSTIGIGGTVDIADGLGLERHEEDFGQTLAVWGADEGMYLELPLLGPNTLRDVPGLPADSVTNVLYYAGSGVSFPLSLLKAVDKRSRLEGAIKLRDESALDRYVFQREAYRQHRRHLIYDGDPPLEDFEDLEDEPR